MDIDVNLGAQLAANEIQSDDFFHNANKKAEVTLLPDVAPPAIGCMMGFRLAEELSTPKFWKMVNYQLPQAGAGSST